MNFLAVTLNQLARRQKLAIVLLNDALLALICWVVFGPPMATYIASEFTDEIIDIFQQSPNDLDAELRSLDEVPTAVDEVRKQVLEAHKLLLKLNPKNSAEFTDLINALESE